MIRSFRHLTVAMAALAAASSAFAGDPLSYDFKSFYNNATFWPLDDTKTMDSIANSNASSIATLVMSDINGGVQGKLTFIDTNFPGTKLSVDKLWLQSGTAGTVAGVSGTPLRSGTFYKSGFAAEDGRYNYDIDFKAGAFKEASISTFTIKGAGLSTASFANKKVMLDIAGAGAPYSGFLGLNPNVHFIGTPTVLPEPSTYALMGLGLLGVAGAARRRKTA